MPKQIHHHVLLRIMAKILLPFIFMFGFYVLFHGKVSPGGGFQGGAICATALILYALIFGVEATENIITDKKLKFIACIGALLYCTIGMASIFLGGKFLEYNAFFSNTHLSQFVGVMGIEIGVQLTVFASLSLIYLKLAKA